MRSLAEKISGRDDSQFAHFALDNLKIIDVAGYEESVFLFDDSSCNQSVYAKRNEFCLRGNFVDIKAADGLSCFPPIIFS